MLIDYVNTGLFCSRNTRSQAWFTPLEHFTLKSTKNSYHLNNTLKVFKFRNTFSCCQMILMVRGPHQSPLGTKIKLKTTTRNLLTRSFPTYDEFRLLELMTPMRLRLCYQCFSFTLFRMLYKVQQHCDGNLSKKKFTTQGGMSRQDEKIKKYIYKQISTL